MTPLEVQILIDEIRKINKRFDESDARFDEFDAQIERCFSRSLVAPEQLGDAVELRDGGSEQFGATQLVVADNWAGLFDSGDASVEQQFTAPIVADNWGGLFEQPAHDPEERALVLSSIDVLGSAQIRHEHVLNSIVPVVPKPAPVLVAASAVLVRASVPEEQDYEPAIFDSASPVPMAEQLVVEAAATEHNSIDLAMYPDLLLCDRLSLLPDVLLRNIVSRLPLKEAVRTVVLSRRWRPLCAVPSASLVSPDPILARLIPTGEVGDIDGFLSSVEVSTQKGKRTVQLRKEQIEARPFFMVPFERSPVRIHDREFLMALSAPRPPRRAPPRPPWLCCSRCAYRRALRLHRPRRAPPRRHGRRPWHAPLRPPRPRRRRRSPLRPLRLRRQRRAPPRPPWLRRLRRAPPLPLRLHRPRRVPLRQPWLRRACAPDRRFHAGIRRAPRCPQLCSPPASSGEHPPRRARLRHLRPRVRVSHRPRGEGGPAWDKALVVVRPEVVGCGAQPDDGGACLHEVWDAVHRRLPWCVRVRRHAAVPALLPPPPPRDATTTSSQVLAAAWTMSGSHSIHAARMFDEMSLQPLFARVPAPVFTSQWVALPSVVALHAHTAVQGAALFSVGSQGLAIRHNTSELQTAELLRRGGDFTNSCGFNLIGAPVVLVRSCDENMMNLRLLSSSDWVEQHPWPPPPNQMQFCQELIHLGSYAREHATTLQVFAVSMHAHTWEIINKAKLWIIYGGSRWVYPRSICCSLSRVINWKPPWSYQLTHFCQDLSYLGLPIVAFQDVAEHVQSRVRVPKTKLLGIIVIIPVDESASLICLTIGLGIHQELGVEYWRASIPSFSAKLLGSVGIFWAATECLEVQCHQAPIRSGDCLHISFGISWQPTAFPSTYSTAYRRTARLEGKPHFKRWGMSGVAAMWAPKDRRTGWQVASLSTKG